MSVLTVRYTLYEPQDNGRTYEEEGEPVLFASKADAEAKRAQLASQGHEAGAWVVFPSYKKG